MNNLLLFSLHEQDEQGGQSTAATRIENRLIRASAGTGKTYQLTSRYLRLLLEGALPESILATTFTRKAAGEILQRVIVRLAAAATDVGELSKLAQAVELPDLTERRCQEKLALLTRHVHRLRILTLDAFFMQIAMSFSLELGLTPGWQIIEEGAESNRLRNEAIAAVLRAESLPNLLTLVHQLLPKGEAQRSLAGMLRGRVGDAYRLYLDSDPEAWDMIDVPRNMSAKELDELVLELGRVGLRTPTMIEARARDLDRILAENWRGFFEGGPTLVKSIMDQSEKYRNSKIPDDLRKLYQQFLPHLRAMVLHSAGAQTRGTYRFLTKYHDQFRHLKASQRLYEFDDITRMLAEQNQTKDLHSFAFRMDAGIDHLLLDEFQDTSIAQWQALAPLVERSTCDESGRSFFCVGDVKQAIYGWRGGSSEIFELLDTRIPNLTNSDLLQSRRSSQVVIDTVNTVFEFLPTWEKLKRGERAARRWTFPRHTTVHQEMPGHVTLETAAKGADAKKETQETEVLRSAASRTASLVVQAQGRSIGILCRKNTMVARMMHELQREGIPASEEGGNALTDSAAVELVLSLLHLADHPADSVAAFHLAASPWHKTADDNLFHGGPCSHQADDPQPSCVGAPDPDAMHRLSLRVRGQLLDDGYGGTMQAWADQLRPFCNRRESRRLSQLVEIAYQYQAKLDSPRQLGFDRQRRTSTRPTAFVRFVREYRVADPSTDAVRVMTVHQAKGLQFDVVILPDLVGPFVEGEDTFLYRRPSISSKMDLVCRYMGKDRGRAFLPSEFLPLFDQHEDRKMRESLCVLYVAMTRAKHALHMIVPGTLQQMRNAKESPAYLLKDALAGGTRLEPATTIYEAGQQHWFQTSSEALDVGDGTAANNGMDRNELTLLRRCYSERSEESRPLTTEILRCAQNDSTLDCYPNTGELEPNNPPSERPPGARRPDPQLARTAGERRRYTQTISPSELTSNHGVRLRDRLATQNDRSRAFGTLLHDWLSHITWLDEPPAAASHETPGQRKSLFASASDYDSRLRAIAAPYAGRLDINQAWSSFQRLLAIKPLTDVLHRAAYLQELHWRLPNLPDAVDVQVRTEQRVVGRDGSAVMSGTIDRLILIRVAGRLMAADIIDFKTDAIDHPDAVAVKESTYRPQLEAYRRLVSTSLRLDPDRVTARFAFLGVAWKLEA